jgi:hypothetical protein
MALGGGNFLVQNKILPGSFINFVSASKATATLSDRGYATIPLILDWGVDGEVFTVENDEFQKKTQEIFGYPYTHEKMKPLRDFFKYAKTGYFYRLNSGKKATNTFATAKHSGTRGNDLKIIISVNPDEDDAFDVETVIDTSKVDLQTVTKASELKDNAYVIFKKDANLVETVSTPLVGGTNSTSITGMEYQSYLDKIESYSFNTMGCPTTESVIIDLFVQFTKRLRDEVGAKFQTVVYRTKADYEGIISVENNVLDTTNVAALVYWTTGAEAGCAVNKSLTNKVYDGEYEVDVDYTQRELENGILTGKLMFHKVGDKVRILDDINSFVSFTDDKSVDFSSNQTIRVLDQIGNDIAVLFNNKYLGQVPNDKAGRISLWNDIVKHHQQMEQIRAIQEFDPDTLTVDQGDHKKAVVITDYVNPVNAMAQLYMTVIVQ